MKGLLNRVIKQWEKSGRRCRTALLLSASAALILAGCGESREAKEARLSGIEKMQEENYAEAVASFDTALEEADGIVNAFELDILKYRGEAEYRLEDYRAAAHTYGILVEVDGEKPEYLYYKAASEAMDGNLATAEADYEKASSADEEKQAAGAGLALGALASAAREAGDYDKAIGLCQSALDGGASNAELYNQMGLCLMEAGRFEEAAERFDQGISLADSASAAILKRNKAAAYEQSGDFAGALELLKEYAASQGSTPEIEKEIAFLESR